eukprot:CAMPEP_0170084750 /NCGR_PEP_ID=MMETSP0019_2-20121128/19846_1 /TAXON_ID=98059 /ORGANISM="Dinobryon sp., Strain UTEXLB2267" /LENGTH=96 /DNA_ID=CAMNT_0010300949 /DNA_START=202 /DNA_END=492 /DNA_ORIENTATION=-
MGENDGFVVGGLFFVCFSSIEGLEGAGALIGDTGSFELLERLSVVAGGVDGFLVGLAVGAAEVLVVGAAVEILVVVFFVGLIVGEVGFKVGVCARK